MVSKTIFFKWGTTQSGTMPSYEYIINQIFDEELFAEVREKRLATLLSHEVHETENKWLGYDFEEAQVKIDITDMILEDMIEEIWIILNEVEINNLKDEDGISIFKILPIELVDMEEQRKLILEKIRQEGAIEAIFK